MPKPGNTATAEVTLQITYNPGEHSHPATWAWDELIDAADMHDVTVVSSRDVE